MLLGSALFLVRVHVLLYSSYHLHATSRFGFVFLTLRQPPSIRYLGGDQISLCSVWTCQSVQRFYQKEKHSIHLRGKHQRAHSLYLLGWGWDGWEGGEKTLAESRFAATALLFRKIVRAWEQWVFWLSLFSFSFSLLWHAQLRLKIQILTTLCNIENYVDQLDRVALGECEWTSNFNWFVNFDLMAKMLLEEHQ